MEEAERLCDRIVIIDHGHVVASGTQEALHAMAPQRPPQWVEVRPSLEDVFLHLTGRQLRDSQ
jgi:ABC-2 type transport system ATP-binding protein